MRRIIIAVAMLAGLVGLADDNIIGILSSGTWTRTMSGNNSVLTWSAGGAAPTGWDSPDNMVLLLAGITNSATVAADESGLSNTGIVSGATYTLLGTNTDATLLNYGRMKYGWSFDGSDDIIQVLSSATISPTDTVSRVLMAWIKPSQTLAENCVFFHGQQTSSNCEMGLQNYSAGYWYPWKSGSGAVFQFAATSLTNASYTATGVWHHVAMAYALIDNGGDYDDAVAVWMDGVLIGTNSAASSTGIFQGPGALEWGQKYGTSASRYRFAGLMADMRMLTNGVLSAGGSWADISTAVSNVYWNTGGKYTNQPWMSDENGY